MAGTGNEWISTQSGDAALVGAAEAAGLDPCVELLSELPVGSPVGRTDTHVYAVLGSLALQIVRAARAISSIYSGVPDARPTT